MGHKYLVNLDRLTFRDAHTYLEHLITKFNLPDHLKNEAILVKEN